MVVVVVVVDVVEVDVVVVVGPVGQRAESLAGRAIRTRLGRPPVLNTTQ